MAESCRFPLVFSRFSFPTLTRTGLIHLSGSATLSPRGLKSPLSGFPSGTAVVFSALALLLLCVSSLAQELPNQPQTKPPNQPAVARNNLIVPAGTMIVLVLTHPIQSRYIHSGDDIYAQIISPVISGNEVAIPSGTFVQGKVNKLARKGGRAELHLQAASITFPNGYVVPIASPLTLESDDGYALKDPGQGRIISAFIIPTAGAGLGALIGHAVANQQPSTITSTLPAGCTGPPPGCLTSSLTIPGSTAKSTVIGAGVGAAVSGVISLVMIMSSHNFYLDVGSPAAIVLHEPLSLDAREVAEAITQPNSHPVQPTAARPQLPPPANPSGRPYHCPVGQEWCNGSCWDTASFLNDSNNCGRCGNHCSVSETCTGGSCTCGPGYTSCMGSCVSNASLISDSSNCGRCGKHVLHRPELPGREMHTDHAVHSGRHNLSLREKFGFMGTSAPEQGTAAERKNTLR